MLAVSINTDAPKRVLLGTNLMVADTRQEKRLLKVYTAMLGLLFVLVVTTPILIHDGYSVFTEEHLEMILLAVLTLAGFFLYRNYRNQLAILQERYHDLSRHLGALNLQTVQIESMFREVVKLPKSKRDLKRTIETLSKNILAAVSTDWVLTRIIDNETGRTLTEQRTERPRRIGSKKTMPEISNKLLLNEHALPDLAVFSSEPANVDVSAFCVFSPCALNGYQKVVLNTAVNNLAILYLIFRSEVNQNGTK